MKKLDLSRIKAERVAKGLTQTEMAEAVGMNRTTYIRKEAGKTDLGVEEFMAIVTYLGFETTDLSIFFK